MFICCFSDALMIIEDIKTVITELEQEQQMAPINVELVDNELAMVYEGTQKAEVRMGSVMRKPAFCICENKGVDQLLSNPAADQRFCFCYINSTILYSLKSKLEAFWHLCDC